MENLFDLTIYEDVTFPASARTDLFQLCNYLDESEEIHQMMDPWYLSEAVTGIKPTGQMANRIYHGKHIIQDAVKMYDDLTTGQGYIYGEGWELLKKMISLIGKIYALISKLLGWIPKIIVKLINYAMDLPENIVNLISGNISLYITADDIGTLYGINVLGKLDEICHGGNKLAKGKTWSTFFQRVIKGAAKLVPGHKYEIIPENEKAIGKRMINNYLTLKDLEFKKTSIKLNNAEIRNLYFGRKGDGKDRNIEFKGIKIMDKHVSTYLEAINILIKSFIERQNMLEETARLMDIKIDNPEAAKSWESLPPVYKSVIADAYKSMSGSINFTAKILKYLGADINTYNKAISKVQKAIANGKYKNVKAIDITDLDNHKVIKNQ